MAKKKTTPKPPTQEELERQRLQRRVEGRNAAKAIIELMEVPEDETAQAAFWDQIRRHVDSIHPMDLSTLDPTDFLKPMSDAEAREFEKRKISFGVHESKTYGQVPIDYLEWIAESTRPLFKYLKSAKARQRQHEREYE